MKNRILTALMCLFSVLGFSQNSDITVNVIGFKSDRGKCLLYIYNNKKGFPTDAGKSIKIASGKISNGKSTIELKEILDGQYAIGIIHDENDNGKLDKNFIGMPKEGVGVSNNAKGHFGPPSFQDSKFQVNKKHVILTITMKYL